ncbi:MAG: hypothetical protein WDA06_02980 [Phenylobacterium sp.]
MTCIAGYIENNVVYIGGDSAGVSGSYTHHRKDQKVFELLDGEIVIGFTSSFRMGQLLRYELKVPERSPGITDMEYMVSHFIKAVRQCFHAGGWLEKQNNMDQGGVFLVGYRGHLYYIDADFQVGESIFPFDACGSGKELAIGALNVLHNVEDLSPEKKVIKALETAERFSGRVKSPFIIKNTKI